MIVDLLKEDGTKADTIELDDTIFAAKISVPLMHQVVVAQLAAARSGSASTKTRAEVRGGGAKPWRQKGTGRARHGSTREPQWDGGGVAFGPKPRSYAQSTPKKMKAAALRSALSVRTASGDIVVVEDLEFEAPKTSRAAASLGAWGIVGKFLLVVPGDDATLGYSYRNLVGGHLVAEHQLNVADVLRSDKVIFTKSSLEKFQERATKTDRQKAS